MNFCLNKLTESLLEYYMNVKLNIDANEKSLTENRIGLKAGLLHEMTLMNNFRQKSLQLYKLSVAQHISSYFNFSRRIEKYPVLCIRIFKDVSTCIERSNLFQNSDSDSLL